MRKTKLLFRVGEKTVKRALKGQLKYHDKGVPKVTFYAASYLIKYGPKAFVKKTKQAILSIDRRSGNNLSFPNGLVSGVDEATVLEWYQEKGKPVTVIIPSYNDLEVLIPCLKSIADTTDPDLVKVLVVDDYCQPDHSLKLKELASEQVSIIFRKKNGGFAKAVNTGLRAANKKHDVILVNSDIVAHAGWVEGLQYGAYEFGTDVGIVGPKLLYPDGRIQSAGSYRNTDNPIWFDHYYRFQDANYGPANVPHYCLATTGACMYVKREFLEYVGILDEKFAFAFEDADWCIRGWEAGYRTLYFPSATLTHVESATRSKNTKIKDKEMISIKYFWSKWGAWFDDRKIKDKKGRIRIIFVLQTLGLSGGIRMIFEQANLLQADKFNVEIWGLEHRDRPWDVKSHVRVRTFKNYDRLITALSNEEAIKVATWWETAFPVWLASVKKGIPAYFIQEFETWFYPDDIVAQSTVVSCYRKEFKNMTTSKYNLEEITDLGLKATAIPCGYDPETYKKIPSVKRLNNTVLGVGRQFFQKNFNFTFNAWKSLGETRPDLWLFGAEPEMAKLDKKITYFNKPSNEEVNKLYNQATIFVQTSRHEGFSLPILEAMAAGCPVICTDAHGNRDFCVNGKNCLMVDHDDIEGLKKAIKLLMSDEKLRTTLSAAGLKTARSYRWDVVGKKVAKFYENVASQPEAEFIDKAIKSKYTVK